MCVSRPSIYPILRSTGSRPALASARLLEKGEDGRWLKAALGSVEGFVQIEGFTSDHPAFRVTATTRAVDPTHPALCKAGYAKRRTERASDVPPTLAPTQALPADGEATIVFTAPG